MDLYINGVKQTYKSLLLSGYVGKEGHFKKEAEKIFELFKHCYNKNIGLELSPDTSLPHIIYLDWLNFTKSDYSESSIILYTSGTTGIPKKIVKSLQNMILKKKGNGTEKDTWLLTYEPWRWAGLSVFLHVIKNKSKIKFPDSLQPKDLLNKLDEVGFVSLTPSLFKKLMMVSDKKSYKNVQQVTFGGEYAYQKILDDAKKFFPNARISHVYASTELSDICAASDGLEGYPLSKIKGYSLENGELFINGATTGDVWREEEGRLKFVGRTKDIIIVGGANVSLPNIEKVIEEVDGILDAKCFSVDNPILGQAVGVEYVGPITPRDLKRILLKILPKAAIPIKYKAVDEIKLTPAGKKKR